MSHPFSNMLARGRAEAPAAQEYAVVDVGSNSVRLVLYRVEGRAMMPFLNEKVLAGLGRGVSQTGRLPPLGVASALTALRRYRALIDGLEIKHVLAVATAAVRSAEDGEAFVAQVRKEIGLPLRVIAGEEEARLSALGVLAGAAAPSGVVGDLGGSSLEIVRLAPDGPAGGETFAVGPLALMGARDFDGARVAEAVDAALAAGTTLQRQGGAFYAVGGAWRALGRIDIALRNHPLGVLHGYEMSRAEALRVADLVAKQSRKSLEKIGDFAEKRAETLPYAAIVLDRVLRAGAFDRVVLSSFGLREGLIFDQLEARARAEDPLVASAAAFGARDARTRRFVETLAAWLEPVFAARPETFPAEARLRAAAARLADIGALLHPDQRADVTFELVLRGPLAGVTHAERAFLAAAVHHRYTRGAPSGRAALDALLTEPQRRTAAAFGAAMRLGADLSGRSDAMLGAYRLNLEDKALALSAPGRPGLLGEPAPRRLETVAALLGVAARIDA